MTRACSALLITLGALLSACGTATLDESVAALQDSYNAKDYAAVVAEAAPLLKRCDAEQAPSSSVWRIEKLRLQSLAWQGQGADALADLERLEADNGDKVNAKLYNLIGGFVTEAGNYQDAIVIFDAGKTKFPDMAALFAPKVEDLKQRVLEGGSDADRDALKQLGYL